MAAPTDVAVQLAALRTAAGEVDALAAVTETLFSDSDWVDPDPVVVDRVASLLGLMAKVAPTLITEVEKLHSAVADAMPATAGGRWDYDSGTSLADRTRCRPTTPRSSRAAPWRRDVVPNDLPNWPPPQRILAGVRTVNVARASRV